MASYGLTAWGDAQLNPSVDIQTGVNDTFAFKVDGVDYTITLTAGIYKTDKNFFTSELIGEINAQLSALASCPVVARLGGILLQDGTITMRHKNILVLEHNVPLETGHSIDTFTGTAVATILGGVVYREAGVY